MTRSTLWREIVELTRVRVVLFVREPEAVFWVLIFPLVLAAVLGFAFRRTETAPSLVAVLEGEGAEALVARLELAEHLSVELAERAAAEQRLRRGALDALVEPASPPRLHFDPDRPEAETARLRLLLALDDDPETPRLEAAPVTAVGSRYIDFLFPGLLGMNLMGTGMWSLGFAIADLRQRKVLKRLLVTPMRRSSFLLSLMLSRLVTLVLEVAVLVGFAVWLLGVPFRAGLIGFLLLCFLGAFVFAGLGLLAVSRAQTIQGASGLLNFVMMPMWLCSGVFFAYQRFPEVLHPIFRLLPLSALNDALRATMLDGASLLAIGPEMLILAAWGALSFVLALRVFRWA